ncbi:MAG: nucleoside deaminase, partial [Pseudomonadota bacterium]|nr:nucleoside deaminase [Pseudomonadota bacterium]
KILKEVFGLEPGGYRRQNAFWRSFALSELVDTEEEQQRAALQAQSARIRAAYDRLSDAYQSGKADNAIPLR